MSVSEVGVRRAEIGDLATEEEGERTEDGGQKSDVGRQSSVISRPALRIALLTAGRDKPYALGMAAALTSIGITVDFIGSDEVASPKLIQNRHVRFLNYRDQRSDAGLVAKMWRVMAYYWRLIRYAATTEVKVFH